MQSNIESIYTPEHKKARAELEYYIPPDLAVKFPNTDFSKINKEAKELLSEISLRVEQKDKQAEYLFLKILEYNKTKYSQEELSKEDQEFLDSLEKESEKEKKELINSLLINILYQKGLSDSDSGVREGTAQSLGELAKVNPELAGSLYQKGLSDSNEYHVRKVTARSLGELAKVNPELAGSLYQKGLSDSNGNVREVTAQSLGELAKVNPELYLTLYQKGLSDSDSGVRQGTARSLGVFVEALDFSKFNNFQKVIKDIGIDDQNKENFIYSFSYCSLNKKDNVFKDEIKKAILNYDTLFEFSKKQNESQEMADKKVKDIDKWWQENNLKIATLLSLDQEKAKDLLSNLIPQGLPKTESALKLYDKSLQDNKIKEILETILQKDIKNQINGNMLGILLETSTGFKNLNAIAVFQKTVEDFLAQNKDRAFDIIDLQTKLGKKMLEVLAVGIGIKDANIKSQDLGKWDLIHLPHLITNAEMIRERGKKLENQLELYKSILKACFEDRFDQFITDINQEDKTGKDIAKHNQKVREAFKKIGIDWDEWLGFSEELAFDIVAEKEKSNITDLFSIIKERFSDFSDKLQEQKEPNLLALSKALGKDIQEIEKSKKNLGNIVKDINTTEELLNKFIPSFTKTFNYLKNKAQKEGLSFELLPELSESYSHLLESLQSLIDSKKEPKESNLQKERFRVRKWKRDPRTDFFQGNYTHCCIAVGIKPGQQAEGLHTHHPHTIQQYLADQGIQVVEVIDEDGRPIAQTWVFVSNNNGRPLMVMDNFEINAKYAAGKPGNTLIKENVFEFMKYYAQKCGIDKVVLGNVRTNDINTEGLKSANTQSINKLGDYLWNERYYLEALGQSNPHLIAENILGAKKKEKRQEAPITNGYFSIFNINTGDINEAPYTQTVVDQIMSGESNLASAKDLEILEKIEETKFAQAGLEKAASDIEDLLETLRNTKGIQMLFRDEAGILKGYLSSKPAPDAKENIISIGMEDPDFTADPRTLYIESIAGTIGRENYPKILDNLKDQARRAGYTKLCLHGINPKLNASLKTLGFEKKREVKNWIGGYSAEYMEMEV